jgi:osmoprotectant transport system permease protein
MRNWLFTFFVILNISMCFSQEKVIRVGAKHFNEGYILSEMIAILLEDGGFKVDRKFNLGGTAVTFEALRNSAIDVYPEYTGTISTEILKQSNASLSVDVISKLLQSKFGLSISGPYGFNNTYALVLSAAKAKSIGIKAISELRKYGNLKLGLSHEFLKREDGWENLKDRYELPHQPIGLEHGLAYQAINESKIDITDAYSTDAEILRYNLVTLQDDLNFFPEYKAVSFSRSELPEEAKN